MINDVIKASKRPDKVELEKVTANDKWSILENTFNSTFIPADDDRWSYNFSLSNYDDNYVYIVSYDYGTYTRSLIRVPYTMDGVNVEFGSDDQIEIVESTTVYEVKKTSTGDEEDLEKSKDETWFLKMAKSLGFIKAETSEPESMTVDMPLYMAYDEVDAHGDAYWDSGAAKQLIKAVNDAIGTEFLVENYFHEHAFDELAAKDFKFIKAWYNEEEVQLEKAGEMSVIPAGQPMLQVEFLNKKAFELYKSGEIANPSIGCNGEVVDIEEDGTQITKTINLLDFFNTEEGNVKRLIKSFSFDKEGHHIALTHQESQNGPASQSEGYVMSQDLEKGKKKILSQSQLDTIAKAHPELDIEDLFKSSEQDSSSSSEAGEEETLNKNTSNEEEKMSNKAILKAAKIIAKVDQYNFEDGDTVAEMLLDMDESVQAEMVKCFDALVAAGETAKEEAVSAKEAEIAKANETQEDSPLSKALSEEQGDSQEPEQEPSTTLSLKDQLRKSKATKEAK